MYPQRVASSYWQFSLAIGWFWPYSGYSSEAISSDVYNRSPQPQADVHLIQEIKSQVNSALTAIPKAQVTLIYNISHGR